MHEHDSLFTSSLAKHTQFSCLINIHYVHRSNFYFIALHFFLSWDVRMFSNFFYLLHHIKLDRVFCFESNSSHFFFISDLNFDAITYKITHLLVTFFIFLVEYKRFIDPFLYFCFTLLKQIR